MCWCVLLNYDRNLQINNQTYLHHLYQLVSSICICYIEIYFSKIPSTVSLQNVILPKRVHWWTLQEYIDYLWYLLRSVEATVEAVVTMADIIFREYCLQLK